MALDIRVGDIWKCRNGSRVKIIHVHDRSYNSFPFIGELVGSAPCCNSTFTWTQDGYIYLTTDDEWDLIDIVTRSGECVGPADSLEYFRWCMGGKPVYHDFET